MFAVESGEGLTRERSGVDVNVGVGVFLGVTQGVDVLLSHVRSGVEDGMEAYHLRIMICGHERCTM
eukprot:16130081-Heterocapsa_arctica.AAC.1